MKFKKEARELAAQCWCDPETEKKVMDPELAEAFAKRLSNLLYERFLYYNNSQFYLGLLEDCAEHLGEEVFISDDGSVQEDPLMTKIPELVREKCTS